MSLKKLGLKELDPASFKILLFVIDLFVYKILISVYIWDKTCSHGQSF